MVYFTMTNQSLTPMNISDLRISAKPLPTTEDSTQASIEVDRRNIEAFGRHRSVIGIRMVRKKKVFPATHCG